MANATLVYSALAIVMSLCIPECSLKVRFHRAWDLIRANEQRWKVRYPASGTCENRLTGSPCAIGRTRLGQVRERGTVSELCRDKCLRKHVFNGTFYLSLHKKMGPEWERATPLSGWKGPGSGARARNEIRFRTIFFSSFSRPAGTFYRFRSERPGARTGDALSSLMARPRGLITGRRTGWSNPD